MEKAKLVKLQELAKLYPILYVEDNVGLRNNMQVTLEKLFPMYTIRSDGQEGYEAFKECRFPIVITDINMPHLNGFEMTEKIKTIAPDTKVIVLSSFEEKENLHKAIKMGIFRFLAKPTQLPQLMDTLHDALIAVQEKNENRIFQEQLNHIFNYQDNLLMMFKDSEPIMANQTFLDFFHVENLASFLQKYQDLNSLLSEHENFLYSDVDQQWIDTALENIGKLYNVKIDSNGTSHHMLMKIQKIPQETDYYILSFNDITELDLWSLYNTQRSDPPATSQQIVNKMMKILYENKNSIKLLNRYKGITICNESTIVELKGDDIIIKTSVAQMKAIKLFKQVLFTSDVFPVSFAASGIEEHSTGETRIILCDIMAIKKINLNRNKVRVTPEPKHKFTLFTNGFTSMSESMIVDISIDAIKVRMSDVPFGLKGGCEVTISFVLFSEGKPLIITTTSTILRMDRYRNEMMIVFAFDLVEKSYQGLNDYIGRRQRVLIDEFKALDVVES